MKQKSCYSPKTGAVLYALSEVDLSILEQHPNIKRISLWLESLAVPNLDFLLKCKRLEEVVIYGGKVSDYSALGKLPHLKELFLNGRLRRWLENFDFLQEIHSLEKLSIYNYPMFTCFPNLQKLDCLHDVKIWGCKQLENISNVALISNLKSFGIVSTPQTVENLEFIAQMPKMERMSGAFGSKRKDEMFHLMLDKYNLVYG